MHTSCALGAQGLFTGQQRISQCLWITESLAGASTHSLQDLDVPSYRATSVSEKRSRQLGSKYGNGHISRSGANGPQYDESAAAWITAVVAFLEPETIR